jgi:carbonic anhydrase
MVDLLDINAAQLAKFPFQNNFRPPQDLGDLRQVYELSQHPTDAAAVAAVESGSFHWGYAIADGPLKWGSFYAGCNGKQQSPIDIITADVEVNPSNQLALYWNGHCGFQVVNNGHTVQVSGYMGNTMFEGQGPYQILQFHFHTGSENLINGQQFALELHIVHKDTRTGGLLVVGVMFEVKLDAAGAEAAAAAAAGAPSAPSAAADGHRRAKSCNSDAERLQPSAACGTPNCWLHNLGWDNLPSPAAAETGHITAAAGETECRTADTVAAYYCTHLQGRRAGAAAAPSAASSSTACLERPVGYANIPMPVNPEGVLPDRRDYYTFAGSLTTPPCSEGVRWVVMRDSVHISKEQVAAFRALFVEAGDTRPGAGNFRPPQALNGRKVSLMSPLTSGLSTSQTWSYSGEACDYAVWSAGSTCKARQEAEWRNTFKACGGNQQSPIEVNRRSKQFQVNKWPELILDNIAVASGYRIRDDQHTIRIEPIMLHMGSGEAGFALFESNQFAFDYIAFRSPSDHVIEGAQFPLEMQIYFKNSADDILAISRFYRIGASDGSLAHLHWADLASVGKGNSKEYKNKPFDLRDLLPLKMDYYNYDGSLTQPPCTEKVTWVLLESFGSISDDQYNQFPYRDKANRPLQQLGDRIVMEMSMHSKDKSASKTANSTSGQCLENGGSAVCWAWGYDMKNGPLKWGRYFPDCSMAAQSPILLESCQIINFPTAGNKLQFKWNGELPKVLVNRTSTSLTSVFNTNAGDTIFQEQRWRLMKMQFHASSEHEIDDMTFPLELEVFHQKLSNNGELLPDQLILSILYEFGSASPFLSALGFDANCSDTAQISAQKSCMPGPLKASTVSGDLNLSTALPANDGYYWYTGSLSTPPCTEGVLRVVMKSRATLSPGQLLTFPFTNNFRPVQPVCRRSLYYLSSGSNAQDLDFAYQTTWSFFGKHF